MIFINTTAAVVLEAAEFQSAHSCIGERNEASNCQGRPNKNQSFVLCIMADFVIIHNYEIE